MSSLVRSGLEPAAVFFGWDLLFEGSSSDVTGSVCYPHVRPPWPPCLSMVSVWYSADASQLPAHGYCVTVVPGPLGSGYQALCLLITGLTFMCQSIRCANRAVCHFPRYSISRCSLDVTVIYHFMHLYDKYIYTHNYKVDYDNGFS